MLLGKNEVNKPQKDEAQGQDRGGRGLVLKQPGPSLWPEALRIRRDVGLSLRHESLSQVSRSGTGSGQ